MTPQLVEFKVDRETLRGTMFVPSGKGPFPGVIFFHGRGSSRERYLPMAECLSKKGMLTLAFDFRGCGVSDGKFENQTYKMGVEDGRAALEFLLKQSLDKNRIGIQGTSFGGYVAGMILKDNRYLLVKSLVLRVPAAFSDQTVNVKGNVESGYFKRRENWINSSAFSGLEKFRGALLVIKSEKDDLIPSDLIQKYYDVAVKARKRELFVHKNAGHSLSGNPKGLKEFHKITEDWFLRTL